jgi:hypothetical protein
MHIQTALRLSLCVPKVYGFENLPKNNETVVYVPNHTSFIGTCRYMIVYIDTGISVFICIRK